jgi:hypothetical protein
MNIPATSPWVLVLVLCTIFWGTITLCLLTDLKIPPPGRPPHRPVFDEATKLLTLAAQRTDEPMTTKRELSVIPVDRVGTIDDIQQRIARASNVGGVLEGLAAQWRAAGAVAALKAQVPHARAVVECVEEHTKILEAMDHLFEASLQVQMRRDLATEIYDSRADDERDKLSEAQHARILTNLRRQKEEALARRELESLGNEAPIEIPLSEQELHEQDLGRLRREKESLEAQREVVSAKHGLEAEHTLKPARFELGRRRLEGKIAEVEVGVAVARNAAGQDANPAAANNESIEVGILHQLIQSKEQEILDAEADGKDSAVLREQVVKLKELLSLV